MPRGPFRLPEGQSKPLESRRGGSVCDPDHPGGILMGSGKAAVCMPTLGTDSRPRWRAAGDPPNVPSRHSTQWAQHRQLRPGRGGIR